jgi:hypothetical protein
LRRLLTAAIKQLGMIVERTFEANGSRAENRRVDLYPLAR